MRIATFNIENIFQRDTRLIDQFRSQSILKWFDEFDDLRKNRAKGVREIHRMRELHYLIGFHNSVMEPNPGLSRKTGRLYLRQKDFPDYSEGYSQSPAAAERKNYSPNSTSSVRNKARLISEVNPDVLILQEVEDRYALLGFNRNYLPVPDQFAQVISMSGNDSQGRGMGLLLKKDFSLKSIKTYSNLTQNQKSVFDKDFQIYHLTSPVGKDVLIFNVHLQDSYGQKKLNDQRRRLQSHKVTEVYQEFLKSGFKNIIVAGTFNSPSFSNSLLPIFRDSDLKDMKYHPSFNVDFDKGKNADYFRLGAYRMGVNIRQRDYMLLTRELLKKIECCGLNRKGIWPEKVRQWRCFNTVNRLKDQASSHPLIWADINLSMIK